MTRTLTYLALVLALLCSGSGVAALAQRKRRAGAHDLEARIEVRR